MNKKYLLPALIVIGLIVTGINVGRLVTAPPRTYGEGTVETGTDPELAAAVIRAKRELPKFKAALAKGGGEFAVNAKFSTPVGPEQVWVKVERFEAGKFIGTIASEPVRLDKKKGDPVRIEEKDVSDWTYKVGGAVEGGFTTQVLAGKR